MKRVHSQGMRRRPTMGNHRQRGLTLVELLVAMVLGLMVIAAVGSVYLISSRNLTQQDAESRLQQTGAAAMAVVTQQLQKAGLVDMPADWPGWQDATPGMDRFGYLLGNVTAPASTHLPASLHGCDNDYAAGNTLSDLTCKSTGTGPAALTVAWQVSRTGEGSLQPIATPACLGSTDVTKLPSAPVNNLTYLDAAGTVTAVTTTWAACRISYDAATSSIQLAQSNTLAGVPPAGVAENVADLRFRYLVSKAGDSSRLIRYATASELGSSGAADWSDVTGVEVCLLARVAVPSVDSKTYLSCEVDPADNSLVPKDVTDNFLYRAVRSVVVLRSRVQANPASL